MDKFSQSESILKNLESIKAENEALRKELELKKMLEPIDPFPKSQLTEKATKKRIEKANQDFWYFDKKYFPKSMYQDWAPPGAFHKSLISLTKKRDKKAHVVLGPRDSAKTATYKKWLAWSFLFGKRRYMGVGSSTLTPATNTIRDIRNFLMTNPRIIHDFDLLWGETSEERLFAKSKYNPQGCFMDAISEERSTKGSQRNFFLRYDFIFITDLENEESSLTQDAVERRIRRLNEMRTSLSTNGTLIWEGNNFHQQCAMNQLKREHEKGVISENFEIHTWPAWDENRNPKNIWHSKYPADSEKKLRKLMKPKDQYDWDGNFQQGPSAPSGDIYKRENYQEWKELPDDLVGVIWVDPNLSKKDKGDRTSIITYCYSAKIQKYIVPEMHMQSYSDSNNLLDEYFGLWLKWKRYLIALGFDGNVNQESTWDNNVRQYARQRKVPLPTIEYRHYTVDNLVKNSESEWNKGNILFPPGFSQTEMGRRVINQITGFRGKKANNPDDAPDSMICAHELLVELGVGSMLHDDFDVYTTNSRKLNERF